MQMAIDQAKDADYPFGAVIVRGGRVLAFGRNSTKRNSDPTAHAEMMAIRAFLNGHEPDDLKEATLYTSGEPCVMCMGAIIWCGIKRLVFAASIAQLSTRIGQIDITAQANRQRGAVLQHRDRRRPAVAPKPCACSPEARSLSPTPRRNSCVRHEFIVPTTTRSSTNAQCSSCGLSECPSASSS